MTQAITRIERARGFLEAAQLSADWVREVGEQALILEAHHTTHIEGTRPDDLHPAYGGGGTGDDVGAGQVAGGNLRRPS